MRRFLAAFKGDEWQQQSRGLQASGRSSSHADSGAGVRLAPVWNPACLFFADAKPVPRLACVLAKGRPVQHLCSIVGKDCLCELIGLEVLEASMA